MSQARESLNPSTFSRISAPKRSRNPDQTLPIPIRFVSHFYDLEYDNSHLPKPKISSKELNPDLRPDAPRFETPQQERKTVPGGPGSQWRMMRLRRVYETAEEEGKPVEEIALDRFGSLEAFEEAKAERRILDERAGRRSETPTNFKGKGRDGEHEKRFMFTDVVQSGASSRSSTFRRPDVGGSIPSTPSPAGGPPRQRYDSLRLPSQAGKDSPAAMSRTPIPTVMTPQGLPNKSRALSPSSLNKLQAKALRAKLRGAPDAASLEKEYEEELRRSSGGGDGEDQGRTRTQVEVLPTLDAQGRLYDVGQGKDDGKILPGNRKKKEKVSVPRHNFQWFSHSCTRSRHEILRLESLSGIMQTTTPQHLGRCYARSGSVLEWQIKRTWMHNTQRPSCLMASLR